MTREQLKQKDWSGEHFCLYQGKEYRIIQVDLVEDLVGLLLPDNFIEDDFELTWVRCESVQIK